MTKKRVLLIGGHGAGDPGAVANGHQEAELVKELASHVGARLLRDYQDVEVVLYNVNRDAYRDNVNGIWQAGWNYDLIIEWHINAGGGTGFEHLKVANANTGKFVTESANMLKQFYRNRGVKTASLLNPSIANAKGVEYGYVELFFLDNKQDLVVYLNNKSAIIDGQVAAIANTLQLQKKEPIKTTPKPQSKKYQVGDKVRFSTCYVSSMDTIDKHRVPAKGYNIGVITKILPSARNPYLINKGQCWINDGDIREVLK